MIHNSTPKNQIPRRFGAKKTPCWTQVQAISGTEPCLKARGQFRTDTNLLLVVVCMWNWGMDRPWFPNEHLDPFSIWCYGPRVLGQQTSKLFGCWSDAIFALSLQLEQSCFNVEPKYKWEREREIDWLYIYTYYINIYIYIVHIHSHSIGMHVYRYKMYLIQSRSILPRPGGTSGIWPLSPVPLREPSKTWPMRVRCWCWPLGVVVLALEVGWFLLIFEGNRRWKPWNRVKSMVKSHGNPQGQIFPSRNPMHERFTNIFQPPWRCRKGAIYRYSVGGLYFASILRLTSMDYKKIGPTFPSNTAQIIR